MTESFTLAQVLKMLRDENLAVRYGGLALLPRLPREELQEAVHTAIELSTSSRGGYGMSQEICRALAEAGPAVISSLERYVDESVPAPYLYRALMTLWQILSFERHQKASSIPPDAVSEKLVAAVVQHGLHHPTADIRWNAGRLLSAPSFAGKPAAAGAAKTLVWWFTDRSADERWFGLAADALVAIGAPALPALKRALTNAAEVTKEALGNSPDASWQQNIVRDRAGRVIEKLGSTAVPLAGEIVQALELQPPSGRQSLAAALAAIGCDNGAVLPQVLSLIPRVDGYTRGLLHNYLANQGEIGLPHLISMLESDYAPWALDKIVLVGLKRGDLLTSAVPKLLPLLEAEADELRVKAAWALGTMGKLALSHENVLNALYSLRDRLRDPKEALTLALVLIAIDAIEHDSSSVVGGILDHVRFNLRRAA